MSNFSPYADLGYIALIKEATAGTAVTPTIFLRMVSQSLEVNYGSTDVMEIAGTRERMIRSVPNRVEVSGDVEFYVESKQIGHFLRSVFGAPTTQTLTSNVAYRHGFGVGATPLTYTVDICPGNAPWAYRYVGVMISNLKFEVEDNMIKCTATLSPRKAFTNARVTTAVASGTALAVDQTAGLTTSDTILVIDKTDGYTTKATLTISAVGSDTALTVSTIGTSLAVDDIVVIRKAQTVTYDQDKLFTFLGGSGLYSGADIDNTSIITKEAVEIEYKNEVEPKWLSGLEESSRLPGDIITKGFSSTGLVTKFYDSQSNIDKMRKNDKIGFRWLLQGETALEANAAVAAYSEWGASNGFRVTAAAAGKAGNDISVTLVIATSDNLSVTRSGNNIIVALANTTASKNTGTLIFAAINSAASAIVTATAVGTGATQFTTAVDSQNLGFYSGQTNVVGRDASEKPYLQLDFACAKLDANFPGAREDDVLMEEIPLKFYQDLETASNPKKWSDRVFLVNSVSSY